MGDAAGTVTGITGGSVIINCVYSHENVKTRENAKSFCKMLDSECTTVTEVKNDLWIPEERFSMIDDKSLGLVNVLIRNLTVNDSGTYRCKADSTWFQEVKFNVEQDNNERISLNDNEQKHVLTATIASVSRRDDGVYFCGTGNTPRVFLFKEIRLHVSGDKGKARTDALVQSDLYIIILVVMCLILLLAGGLTLLLLNQRCKKMHGSGSSHQGNMREGDDEGVSSPHYEAVSDSGNTPLRPSAQKPISLNTVYDTACLPTNPSDSDFYILAEQP
ncbi:polymeric immunoglobulin receptor-like isoform X1 [Labeo rohita]|nr:polymeric immunoglobulin receptor-like isoform X1 [Labeo rohita]RXN37311.1 polymeric immunoglobulin receptor-like isoform X1 [Labeo rohita]